MAYIIPNGDENESLDVKKTVLIGPNGSGKTRLSVWIEENNTNVHRVSAQKVLNFSDNIVPTGIEKAEKLFLYGTESESMDWLKKYGKNNARWGKKPNTNLLNDFDKLMTLLYSEKTMIALEDVEIRKSNSAHKDRKTKLDQIFDIWGRLIPNKSLKVTSGQVLVYQKDGESYNAVEMSDGERVIFYFIGEVLCSPVDSIIIIDEPENHLNKAIISKLWDSIENLRDDCTFIYCTHEIDFAMTRDNATIIWMREYLGNNHWDYKIITEDEDLPKDLFYQILGSREPILFVEGKKTSDDKILYTYLFDDHHIISIEGCKNVIEMTKAFNRSKNLHHKEVYGLIDRDFRTDEVIENLRNNNIYITNVSEIENLFILKEVIMTMINYHKPENISMIEEFENRLFQLYKEDKDNTVIKMLKYNVRNRALSIIDSSKGSIESFKNIEIPDFNIFVTEIEKKANLCLDSGKYDDVLTYYDNKGLYHQLKLVKALKLNNKQYKDSVIALLRKSSSEGEKIKEHMMNNILKPKNI